MGSVMSVDKGKDYLVTNELRLPLIKDEKIGKRSIIFYRKYDNSSVRGYMDIKDVKRFDGIMNNTERSLAEKLMELYADPCMHIHFLEVNNMQIVTKMESQEKLVREALVMFQIKHKITSKKEMLAWFRQNYGKSYDKEISLDFVEFNDDFNIVRDANYVRDFYGFNTMSDYYSSVSWIIHSLLTSNTRGGTNANGN